MKKINTLDMAQTALLTALLCVTAPFQIPIGEVPVTLATMTVILCSVLAGWKKGTVCTLLYLLLGAAGVPVFAGYAGGFSVFAGPTGGYLWGYPVLALTAGLFYDYGRRNLKNRSLVIAFGVLGCVIGTVLLYALGTSWFVFVTEFSLTGALAVCVYPFILFDLAKIIVGVVLGDILRTRLKLHGLFID